MASMETSRDSDLQPLRPSVQFRVTASNESAVRANVICSVVRPLPFSRQQSVVWCSYRITVEFPGYTANVVVQGCAGESACRREETVFTLPGISMTLSSSPQLQIEFGLDFFQ